MRAADYAKSESAAYECLLKYCDEWIPIDVERAIENCCRAHVMTYKQAGEELGIDVEVVHRIAPSEAAFMMKLENPAYIMMLTSEHDNAARNRFSLAHELGHVVLGHTSDDAARECEANAFAAAFLCPKPVLRATRACDAREVASAFGISLAAAKIAIDNVNRPMRCDRRLSDAVERRFDTRNRARLEDYMTIEALVGFYTSRLRRAKRPPISSGDKRFRTQRENALDDMERLMESRV